MSNGDQWWWSEDQASRLAAGLYGHLTNSEVQSTVARLWSLERKQHAPRAVKANLSSDSRGAVAHRSVERLGDGMATYRAFVPGTVPGGVGAVPGGVYVEAGAILTDSGHNALIPAGWTPPLSVDPQDTEAIENFWAAGPRSAAGSQPGIAAGNLWGYGVWTGVPIVGPTIYWIAYPPIPGNMILTGSGQALGPRT